MSKIDIELLRDISHLEKDGLSQEISKESYNQIIERAQKEITDLKTAVSQNLFFDSPRAKAESEAVFDGLNAVANGMDDSSAFERMEKIEKDSIFQPWKNLVYAIRSFYHGETKDMLSLLDQIKEGTAPAALKPVLRQAAGVESSLNPQQTKILRSIIRETEDSNSDVEKIKECRDAGYFEMLPSLMADYAEKNKNRGENFTQSLTLRCFDIIQEEGPLSYSAIRKFIPVIGEFNSFRLAAVSSLKSYTEQAIFYWIEATNARLECAVADDWEQIKTLLMIIEEVWQWINSEYQLTDDYRSLLLDKVSELQQKNYSIFGEISGSNNNNFTVNYSLEEIMQRFSFKEPAKTIFPEQVPILQEISTEPISQRKEIREQDKKLYTQLEFAF